MRLEDKVAIVTGAGTGIGRATARLFAAEGARVVVATRTAAHGEATVEMIRVAGGEAAFHRTDVSVEDDVAALARFTVERYGKLNILCSNAAVLRSDDTEVTELSQEAWYGVLDINLKGFFLSAKYCIPEMLKGEGGSIVVVNSVTAVIGHRRIDAYTAAKGGMLSLARAMALEYGPRGIRVNSVLPGRVETPMVSNLADPPGFREELLRRHVLGRFGKPEDVAPAILFLASDEASWITGAELLVDGGFASS